MSEYIIDMDNSSYQSTSGLLCADTSYLREEIVRCRDCKYYKETDGLTHFNLAFCKFHNGPCEPSGFCAWGERKPEDD